MQTNAKNLTRHYYALFLILLLSVPLTMHAQMRQVYEDSANNQISRISFLSPSQGFVGFDYWLGYTTDSGRTFTKKYITPANVDFNGYGGVNLTFGFGINGVKAFSSDTVILYGDYGLVPSVLYSVNGGNNFKLVYYSQYSPTQLWTGIEDMVFPQNTGTGYAVDADRILKTTNRGISWTVVRTDPSSFFNHLEAVDDNHLYAFANGYNPNKLLVTQDGGNTWQPASIPAGKVVYINFISLNKGWLNMQNGAAQNLYYTQNGGSSWTLMNNPDITPFLCSRMKFTNDSTGYAIADLFTVYKTTDSGKVWERVPRDNNFTYIGYSHNDLFFINPNQYWAGGGHGFLELNGNAGGAPLPRALFKIDTTGESASQQVSLLNYSKPNYQYAWYVNGTLISNSYSTVYTHDLYTGTDTIMLLVSNGAQTDTAVKYLPFVALPYPAPVVSSFNPQSGPPGTQVTINGNFFKGAVSVGFGDIPAGSFTIVSPTQIIATVGAGDNGNVSVTTPKGTGSLGSFIVFPPPVISSFAPQSGPIGTTVLITGTNFSAVPGGNSVFFGSVRATVTGATATQLTVTAPAGADYKPITVEVNHHIAYANSPFILTFNASCGVTEFSFPNVQTVPTVGGVGGGGYDMVLADFDGDGKTDIAAADGYELYQVWVMRNTSSSSAIAFSDKQTYPISRWRHDITAGDLDGDGKPDLVVTNQDSSTVTVFRNTSTPGAISFVQEGIFATAGGPFTTMIRDIDGDGKADLLVSTGGTNVTVFTVLRNTSINGHVNFAPKIDLPTGLSPHDASLADLDGDGKPDLVMLVYLFQSSTDVSYVVYRNTSTIGTISFAPKTSLPLYGYLGIKSAVGDVDGDGKPDIAMTFNVLNTGPTLKAIGVYRNTSTPGNLSFDTAVTFEGGGGDIKLADLDGDGKPDLITASTINILKNTSTPGHISFVDGLVPPPYGSPLYNSQGYTNVFANDLDNDGRPDLVGIYENVVNIRRNTLGERGAWAGKDTTICQGMKFMLGRQPAAYDHKYAWTSNPAGFSDSVANPVVSPSARTTYYVTVTDWRGCVSADTIVVNVGGPKPAENAGPDRYICPGDSTQIGSNNPAGNAYSWVSLPQGFSSSQLSPYVKPAVTTIYYLTINTGSCIAKDTVQVNIGFAPVANAGPDQLICGSGRTQIGAEASNYTTYSWTSSPAGFSSSISQLLVSPTVTTNYFLVATIGTCTARDTVVVKVAPRPPVNAGPDRAICAGTPTTLGGTANPSLTYQWTTYNDGLVSTLPNPVFSPTVTTAYDLYVHDSVCYNYDTVIVTVNTSVTPAVSITVSDSITCTGANVIFTAHPSNGGSSPSYQWQVNGVNAGSNSNSFSSNSLANGAQVKVIMTGNAPCSSTPTSTSNTITMNVNAVGAPSISISGTVIVNLGSLDTLRTTTVNVGSSPTYQWQDSTSTHGWTNITGAFGASLIYKPLNTGDRVRCIVTSNSACASPSTATSAAFVFTVSKPTAVNSVDPASYGLRLYPDPVYSSLTIDPLRITDKWETLAIVSIDGQRTLQVADIRNRLSVTVPVSGLDKGLYVAVLYKKTGEAVYFKFLKL